MVSLKLKPIGNSVGVILPKEVLARMKVDGGDTLYLTESPEGYRLTPYTPSFEDQMVAAREAMKTHRDALHMLAK